ncbi:hypothetical protein TTHERM_00502160 (macronuclear) [Tetrahymena thermophila SB210]|uniref:Uncharacterized protein n=1 Tax=Tetrahymena thermophila (strain SB210) TaxID=312017 RepID=I7M9K7_TETTS|nr:hypothetical protein TTHERM_00502160 [Tetrahymena thermophila SB210]EAS02025.2 hypothetical protein TTHERM_00502160 [Tetrahymena thermophila SB210]|eukprot:XP_001022270.2 hypothetical protein TTHERM_00502160 [Tetrahymena thermophila SB210]
MLTLEQDSSTLNNLITIQNQLPQTVQAQSQEGIKNKLFVYKQLQSIQACSYIDQKNQKIKNYNFSKNNVSNQKDLLTKNFEQNNFNRSIISKANYYQEPKNKMSLDAYFVKGDSSQDLKIQNLKIPSKKMEILNLFDRNQIDKPQKIQSDYQSQQQRQNSFLKNSFNSKFQYHHESVNQSRNSSLSRDSLYQTKNSERQLQKSSQQNLQVLNKNKNGFFSFHDERKTFQTESPFNKIAKQSFQITSPKIQMNEELYYNKDQKYINALNNKIIREQIDKKIKEQIFGKREAYSNNKRRHSSITEYEYLKTECEQLIKTSFKTQISNHGNAFYNSVILVGQSKYSS